MTAPVKEKGLEGSVSSKGFSQSAIGIWFSFGVVAMSGFLPGLTGLLDAVDGEVDDVLFCRLDDAHGIEN
jgi:hypothetical protein